MNMTNKSVTSQNTSKNIEISNKFNPSFKTIRMEITILPFLWYLVIHRKYLVPIVSERYFVGGPPCSERLFKSLIIAFCLFFMGTCFPISVFPKHLFYHGLNEAMEHQNCLRHLFTVTDLISLIITLLWLVLTPS